MIPAGTSTKVSLCPTGRTRRGARTFLEVVDDWDVAILFNLVKLEFYDANYRRLRNDFGLSVYQRGRIGASGQHY